MFCPEFGYINSVDLIGLYQIYSVKALGIIRFNDLIIKVINLIIKSIDLIIKAIGLIIPV